MRTDANSLCSRQTLTPPPTRAILLATATATTLNGLRSSGRYWQGAAAIGRLHLRARHQPEKYPWVTRLLERVVNSLYHQAISDNVTAQIFWLKNRRPAEWRDVQNIEATHQHYIVADRPMTEQEWIEARADRAQVIPNTSEQSSNTDNVATVLPDTEPDAANTLE